MQGMCRAPRHGGSGHPLRLPHSPRNDRTRKPVNGRPAQRAFTLIELLVVVAVLSLLVSILTPSLTGAKETARSAQCLSHLHSLGVAGTMYSVESHGYFWPARQNSTAGPVYFWGRPADPVDFRASPFMRFLGYQPEHLWCPSQPWGSYVPQAGVNEPTTTYGYNAYCLDPPFWGRALPRRRQDQIRRPAELFVFVDSALYWSPGGVPILQNSTSLDPVTTPWGPNRTATTQFRHRGKTNALCPDGHAESFFLEGGAMITPQHNLGFVGAANEPHYDQ